MADDFGNLPMHVEDIMRGMQPVLPQVPEGALKPNHCVLCGLHVPLTTPFDCKHAYCPPCSVLKVGASALLQRNTKLKSEGETAYDHIKAEINSFPSDPEEVVRLTAKPNGRWGYGKEKRDTIRFQVDKAADFHGCYLYVSTISEFAGTVQLWRSNTEGKSEDIIANMKFSLPRCYSSMMKNKVMLRQPVRLVPKTDYLLTLIVTSTGGSGCGYHGIDKITTASGITVTFFDGPHTSKSNGTCVQMGQIPSIVLSPPIGAGHRGYFPVSSSLVVTRLTPSGALSWGYGNHADSIMVEPSSSVELAGIGMYCGAEEACTGVVTVSRMGPGKTKQVLYQQQISWYSPTEAPAKVFFDECVPLAGKQAHIISVKVTSTFLTCAGMVGKAEIEGPDGTLFRFSNAPNSNGTSVAMGQIPELYYQPQTAAKLEFPDLFPVKGGLCDVIGCGARVRDVAAVFASLDRDTAPTHLCANHVECRNSASLYCSTCSEVFCEECWKEAHRIGKLASHTRQDISSFVAPTAAAATCPHHPTKVLDCYCCVDEVPVCDHCLLFGAHKDHQRMLLNEKIADLKQKFSGFALAADTTVKSLQALCLQGDQTQATLRKEEVEARAALNDLRVQLHARVDEALDAMGQSIAFTAAARCQALAGQEVEAAALQRAVQAKLSQMSEMICNVAAGSHHNVLAAASKYQSVLHQMSGSLTACTSAGVRVDETLEAAVTAALTPKVRTNT